MLRQALGPIAEQKTCSIEQYKDDFKSLQRKVQKLKRLQLHLEIKKRHRTIEQELKAQQTADMAIVYMDFVAFHFNIKKGVLKIVNDLVLVLETVTTNGQRERHYYDYISTDENSANDSKFMRAVFEHVYKDGLLDDFSSIYFFTDGGGKHFKTSFTQRCTAELQRKLGNRVIITWIVFAAYHGWSICDSHGGVLNQLKTRKEIAGEQPKTGKSWIDTIMKSATRNTRPMEIDFVDPREFKQKTMTGIKDCFCFRYYTTSNVLAVQMYEHYESKDFKQVVLDPNGPSELQLDSEHIQPRKIAQRQW
jgi:hypothetical protein